MRYRLLLLAIFSPLFPFWSTAQECSPTITVYSGLAVNIHPIDANKDGMTDFPGAVVRMSDLILRADDYCNGKPFKFGIRRTGQGTNMPADTMLIFTCQDLGYQEVEVWVCNVQGYTSYATAVVNIQDNRNACENPPLPAPAKCAPDNIAPELLLHDGLAGSLRPGSAGTPFMPVSVGPFIHKTYDNCAGPFQYRMRKAGYGTGVPQDSIVVFNCDELGVQPVEIWAGDASGNWDQVQTYVQVEDPYETCGNPSLPPLAGCWPDQTPPQLLVHSGFGQSLTWQPGGLVTRFYAEDFIHQGRDKCHDHMGWRISKPAQGGTVKPPAGAGQSVLFDCSEAGPQIVWIWLRDGAGNWTKVATIALVQNTTPCGPNPVSAYDTPQFRRDVNPGTGNLQVQEAPEAESRRLTITPNPITDGFTVRMELDQGSPVSIYLYDPAGRLARVLAERQWMAAGDVQLYFSRDNLPAGVYRCEWRSNRGVQSAGVVLQ